MKRYLILICLLVTSICYASPAMMAGVMASAPPALTAQTITWNTQPAAMTVGGSDQTLTMATASSGLTVAYTTDTTTYCTIAGAILHAVAAGNCVVHADQAGNGTYSAATRVDSGNVTISATAIAAASKTTGTTDATQTGFPTASVTPTSNALQLLLVNARNANASQSAPTVTGNGLTWVLVDSFRYDVSSSYRDAYLFRAMGASPSAGAATITFGVNQTSVSWSWVEFTGVDTSGTNGSGAVGTPAHSTATTSVTSATATLSAFSSASNATYGGCSLSGNYSADTITQGTGFTKIVEDKASTNNAIMSEWRVDNATTVDFSASGAGGEKNVIAVEIKAQ